MLDQEPMTRIAFASEPGASGTPPVHVGQLPASSVFPAEMCGSFITGLNGSETIIPNFLTRFVNARSVNSCDNERNVLTAVCSAGSSNYSTMTGRRWPMSTTTLQRSLSRHRRQPRRAHVSKVSSTGRPTRQSFNGRPDWRRVPATLCA